MSIMDTLITNRTQADVIAGNAKGTYNASDLNRVGEAEEYLHDLFESYGYSMPNYKRIKLQRPGHYETHTVTKPILPDGYTQLEYIQSTGTQYIDTNWVHKANSKIVVSCNVSDSTRDGWLGIFGSGNPNYKTNAWMFFSRFGNNNVPAISRTGNETTGSNFFYNEDITITAEGNTASWSRKSVEQSLTASGTVDDGVVSMYLLALHEGTSATRFSVAKLYSAQFFTGTVLERDFIPSKRNSDSVIGLYDLVANTFYTNSGTGAFTAGPENIEYETITEEVLVPDERDPYTWFEDDIPTSGMMAQYITNLSELRGQFVQAETTPSVPPKMNELTWKEANNIEKILEDVDALLTNISAAWFFSGGLFSGEV